MSIVEGHGPEEKKTVKNYRVRLNRESFIPSSLGSGKKPPFARSPPSCGIAEGEGVCGV